MRIFNQVSRVVSVVLLWIGGCGCQSPAAARSPANPFSPVQISEMGVALKEMKARNSDMECQLSLLRQQLKETDAKIDNTPSTKPSDIDLTAIVRTLQETNAELHSLATHTEAHWIPTAQETLDLSSTARVLNENSDAIRSLIHSLGSVNLDSELTEKLLNAIHPTPSLAEKLVTGIQSLLAAGADTADIVEFINKTIQGESVTGKVSDILSTTADAAKIYDTVRGSLKSTPPIVSYSSELNRIAAAIEGPHKATTASTAPINYTSELADIAASLEGLHIADQRTVVQSITKSRMIAWLTVSSAIFIGFVLSGIELKRGLESEPDETKATLTRGSLEWNMSEERAFTENLVGQRFNFLMVFFALVMTGAVAAKTQAHLQIILTIGAIGSFALMVTLMCAHFKLHLILERLKVNDKDHPFVVIDRIAGVKTARNFIGYWIPLACTGILAIGATGALFGVL